MAEFSRARCEKMEEGKKEAIAQSTDLKNKTSVNNDQNM